MQDLDRCESESHVHGISEASTVSKCTNRTSEWILESLNDYLGKRASLISKADIRYEGMLRTIDMGCSTISLNQDLIGVCALTSNLVRFFGTEFRREQPVPALDEHYEHITFNLDGLKDIYVHTELYREVLSDNAIVEFSCPHAHVLQSTKPELGSTDDIFFLNPRAVDIFAFNNWDYIAVDAVVAAKLLSSYVGSRNKIDIITNSLIRYEGILSSVDEEATFVFLVQVRVYGTENRPAKERTVARPISYPSIKFQLSETKNVRIFIPLSIEIVNDPAVINLGSQFGIINAPHKHAIPPLMPNILTNKLPASDERVVVEAEHTRNNCRASYQDVVPHGMSSNPKIKDPCKNNNLLPKQVKNRRAKNPDPPSKPLNTRITRSSLNISKLEPCPDHEIVVIANSPNVSVHRDHKTYSKKFPSCELPVSKSEVQKPEIPADVIRPTFRFSTRRSFAEPATNLLDSNLFLCRASPPVTSSGQIIHKPTRDATDTVDASLLPPLKTIHKSANDTAESIMFDMMPLPVSVAGENISSLPISNDSISRNVLLHSAACLAAAVENIADLEEGIIKNILVPSSCFGNVAGSTKAPSGFFSNDALPRSLSSVPIMFEAADTTEYLVANKRKFTDDADDSCILAKTAFTKISGGPKSSKERSGSTAKRSRLCKSPTKAVSAYFEVDMTQVSRSS